MKSKLDEKDFQILRILENNCKLHTKTISKEVKSPITTVFSRIKRLEKLGIIKKYKAILDAEKLNKGTTAFILIEFFFQRDIGVLKRENLADHIYKKLAKLKEIQDLHIITGRWDVLLKVKVKDVKAVGDFVLNKLKMIEGIETTYTLMVLDTKKEELTVL
jgi:DNA-binding Lrp family transcriptional regulator